MQSRIIFLAALICAFGFGSAVHADPLSFAPAADPSSLRSRLFAASRAPAPADRASTSAAVKSTGKMIVKIDAENRSAVATNTKIVCSVVVWVGYINLSRIYTAPAVVTPSKVSCTVTAPYEVMTGAWQSIGVTAIMTNTSVTPANPLPKGFGFVELSPPSIPLPPNGSVTTQTISTVI